MSNPSNPWKKAGFWALSAVLGVMFAGAGASKLAGAEVQIQNFTRWGLPDWFRPVTGIVELVAAVLILVPRTRFYGGTVLAGTMGGGAITHLASGVDLQMIPMNLVLLGLGSFVAWTHRPTWIRELTSRVLHRRSLGTATS